MRMSIRAKIYGSLQSFTRGKPSCLAVWRQFVLGILVLGMSGCSVFDNGESDIPQGTIGHVQGTLGGIAVDEPRAALIGRDILASGGSAVDAATATFFALTVTLPSSVSLGGGGICLIRDHRTQSIETLDFRAKRSASAAAMPDAAAIPGSPRGIFAMHAKYGTLNWGELIRPAENLARFGTEVSRALGQDLKVSAQGIWPDAEMRRIFSTPETNSPHKEGAFFKQVDLSVMLARIRARGASDLYVGTYARQFAEAVQASGPAFTYEELHDYLPEWREAVSFPFIKGTAFYFPSPPGTAGGTAAQLGAMLAYQDGFEKMSAVERLHLLAEATERSLADQPRWVDGSVPVDQITSTATVERLLETFDRERRVPTLTQTLAPTDALAKSRGASLAVIDRNGSAVACSFTMNSPFGVGRIAPGTGVVLAAPPPPAPQTEDSLASVILVSKIGSRIFFASGASGGAVAPVALVNVMANGIVDPEGTLESAMMAKRIHHGGADGVTYLEKGIDTGLVNGLGALGHKMAYVRTLGYVNAVFCPSGIPNKEAIDCGVRSDPRGFGLGVGSE